MLKTIFKIFKKKLLSSTLRTVVVKHFYFFFKVVKNLKIFWTRWERYFGDHGFSSLVNIAHFTNSHVEALYLWKDLCSWKNQKRKVVISKKMGPKKKERYHSVKKRKKIPLRKRLMLAELHADADFEQRSRRQTKLCHTSCWKLGFLFVMQVSANNCRES